KVMAITKLVVRDPAASVDQRKGVFLLKSMQIGGQRTLSCCGIPAAKHARFRHREQDDFNPLLPTQVKEVPQGPVGAGSDSEVLQLAKIAPPGVGRQVVALLGRNSFADGQPLAAARIPQACAPTGLGG